jgi:ammonia channel protein AmtB
MVGAIAIIVWSFATSFPYFFILNKINRLRISPIIEIIGQDELMLYGDDKMI